MNGTEGCFNFKALVKSWQKNPTLLWILLGITCFGILLLLTSVNPAEHGGGERDSEAGIQPLTNNQSNGSSSGQNTPEA